AASAVVAPNRPWDEEVWISGPHNQYDPLSLTVDVEPDPGTVQPCYVLDDTAASVLGVGPACGDFAPSGAVSQDFGDGRDGNHVASGVEDLNPIRASASGVAGSATLNISSVTGAG